MLLISITGNYCFFNLLTVALCVLLPDDDFLLRLAPAAVAAFVRARLMSPAEPELGRSSFLAPRRRSGERTEEETPNIKHQTPSIDSPRGRSGERTQQETSPSDGGKRVSSVTVAPVRERLGLWATIRAVGVGALAVVIALVSGIETTARLSRAQALPAPLLGLLRLVSPLRTINSYGLFSIMTTTRPEIVVEGSNDRSTWLPYEFKWKPGDPKRGPAFVAPHQPRLDWQMWFAALGDVRREPWFLNFCKRLLEGSPSVLAMMARNPFPEGPPRYVRAVVYDYHFTDAGTRRKTGAWWRREYRGPYCPTLTLVDGQLGVAGE